MGVLRRLALVALALWIARWAARYLAAYAGHRLLPPGPPPKDAPRRPGWMPGPFDWGQNSGDGG